MLSLQFSIYSIYNGEILFGSRVSLIVPATLANVVGAFAYVFCPILDQWPGSVGNPRVFRSHRVGLFGHAVRYINIGAIPTHFNAVLATP